MVRPRIGFAGVGGKRDWLPCTAAHEFPDPDTEATMRIGWSTITAATAAALFVLPLAAHAQAPAALAGPVSSAKEVAMEGVAVVAKNAAGTITMSRAAEPKCPYRFAA